MHHERARGRTPSATRAVGRRWESACHALSVSPWPRSCVAFRWGVGVNSFVSSVSPRAPLSRYEAPRRREGRAIGARVHRGWLSPPQSSRGVRATVVIFLCSLSPVVVLVSRVFCGRRFERSEGVAHEATDDARGTREARAYTTGGSRRRSRAGAFARCVGLLLFLFSSCLSIREYRSLAPPAPASGALTTSVRPV